MTRTDARRPDELITAGEIARLAGVKASAVSNWRKRPASRTRAAFPEPWLEVPVWGTAYRGIALFVRAEVEAWLADREARAADRRARRIAKLERELEAARSGVAVK